MIYKSLLLTTLISGLVFSQNTISGWVYEDLNLNGKKDKTEKGIPNIAVSNGQEVTTTDKQGRYTLPIYGNHTIFVVKPSGYKTAINENNLPQFHYSIRPSGSPQNFKYKGFEPTGKLPREVNFPLYKQIENTDFQILVFGDTQPYNLKEIDYLRRGIVNEVKQNKKQAVFGITLGDLVGDDLSLHHPYIKTLKEIGLPWYNVIGNHDMNYEATEDPLSDETFEKNFGPSTYSFNYGNVHFIILDNILYPDPRDGKGYWGGFRQDQLKFIENNLKYVDKNKLIVLAFHIQMTPEGNEEHFRMQDRQALFDLLKPYPNVLMMSAHTHKQTELFYGKKEGWQGEKKLHEINMGTTSGDWYSGSTDSMGVPKSTMRDGTPRGYSFINFKDNQYDIQYKAAGMPDDFMIQLHIPKVVSHKRSSARFFANFFTGKRGDTVEYRIDNGNWKKMEFMKTIDPTYFLSVLKWDETEQLFEGRRPSNPEPSNHIWNAGIPKNLSIGKHIIEVRATDMYGKTFFAKQHFEVQELKEIP